MCCPIWLLTVLLQLKKGERECFYITLRQCISLSYLRFPEPSLLRCQKLAARCCVIVLSSLLSIVDRHCLPPFLIIKKRTFLNSQRKPNRIHVLTRAYAASSRTKQLRWISVLIRYYNLLYETYLYNIRKNNVMKTFRTSCLESFTFFVS